MNQTDAIKFITDLWGADAAPLAPPDSFAISNIAGINLQIHNLKQYGIIYYWHPTELKLNTIAVEAVETTK